MVLSMLLLTFASAIQAPAPTLGMLRARAQERMRQDLATYSAQDFRALEELYQSLTNEIVERFPGALDHGGRPLVAALQNMKLL
jgi:hypothetical protein